MGVEWVFYKGLAWYNLFIKKKGIPCKMGKGN